MANIFDYLKWRGDLTLKQSEFNEIDNLILARLAYFPFDEIVNEKEVVTIKEAYRRFSKKDITTMHILQKEDIDLFPELAKSIRFGNMQLTCYINKVDPLEEKQFSAITILLPDDTMYVAFRGTDNTIVGWKEDFNMSFLDHVASQTDSARYLESVIKISKGAIRVGGHSKGGNLAVYAAAFCNAKTKKRIINVYNNDGPGFSENIIKTQEYQSIIERVYTLIPKSSVVGRLLNHQEKYTIVESTQVGIMQHDLYTWQLLGNTFVCLDNVTNGSEFVDKTITQWLENTTPEQRGKFIDILFQILETTQVKTLSEFTSKWFTNARTVLKTYSNIDDESKEIISQTLSALFSVMKNNIIGNKKEKIEEKV